MTGPDVIVVGGGPAGASTAGLLALDGFDVLLLEGEKFPRYHIGESLISGVLPTLIRLGLRERVDQLGYQRKYGGQIRWGDDDAPITFRFREIRDATYEYAFQVRRADFDALLLDRARELGVRVVEGATVQDVLMDGERVAGVRYGRRGEPGTHEVSARMVIDASGQRRWLGRRFDLVSWHEDMRNVAVWSYYQGALRNPGEFEGDTVSEMCRHGWLWFIPLSREITSIGYVTPSSRFGEIGAAAGRVLERRIAESTEIGRLAAPAQRIDGYRTARDWSYSCTTFSGPGWALVGDAAAFIDPLLSTGVTLAMRGAGTLSGAVREALLDPGREREAMRRYEDGYREFLDSLLELVRFLYEGARESDEFDRRSQAIVDPDRLLPARFSFVTLVSGLARGDVELGISGAR